jgi:HEAT repeat protein
MRNLCYSWMFAGLGLLLFFPAGHWLKAAVQSDAEEDEQILKAAQVGDDGESLLAFLRKRTLTDAKREQLLKYVRDLGSKRFADRRRASRELIAAGTPALALLRQALKDPDVEVVRRATKCIKAIESGPGPGLPAAVVRSLVRRRPARAVETLLAYLPFADNEGVAEEAVVGLQQVSRKGKGLDPALISALQDHVAVRRAAAAFVVAQSGTAKQRALVHQLLKDSDYQVRLQAAHGLAAGGDKQAVPVLIALFREGPEVVAWQAEEILTRIAGEKSPAGTATADRPEARQKAAAAWESWWRDLGPRVDWKHVDLGLLGGVLVAELETDTIWEISPGGKVRWQMEDLEGPYDVQVLAGGRFLIAEYLGQRVTERDSKGTVLWEKKIDDPVACRRLANGDTFIATSRKVLQITAAGKQVFSFTLPKEHQPIYGAHVAVARRSAFLACKGGLLILDLSQKPVQSKKLDTDGEVPDIQALPGGNLLVTVVIGKTAKLKIIDAAGKSAKEWKTRAVSSATRFANGNILAASKWDRSLSLIDSATQKVIWTRRTEGRPIRVCRR